MSMNKPFKTTGKGDEVILTSEATNDYTWDDYDSIVKIQWSIKVRAAGELHARRQIADIVNSILEQTNYTQEVSDESIEIDLYK
jgi:hypothetical protein